MKEERQNKAQDSVVVLYGMGFVCACFEGRRAATNQQKSQWRLTHMLFFSLSCPCPVHFSPHWPILLAHLANGEGAVLGQGTL